MTFLELQDEVLLYLDESGDTDVTRTVVKQALNQANRHRLLEQDWSFGLVTPPVYQTLTAGVREVSLPANCRRVHRLYNVTQGWDYEEVPFGNLPQYSLPSATNTDTRLFYLRGEGPRVITFFAPPTADEIEIHYFKTPTTMVADGDQPDLPATHHDLLVWDALIRLKLYHSEGEGFSALKEFQREAHEALLWNYGMGSHTVAGQSTYIRYIP